MLRKFYPMIGAVLPGDFCGVDLTIFIWIILGFYMINYNMNISQRKYNNNTSRIQEDIFQSYTIFNIEKGFFSREIILVDFM